MSSILHGNVTAAYAYNKLVFLVLPAMIIFMGVDIVRLVRNKK
jgi:hypothetical protein